MISTLLAVALQLSTPALGADYRRFNCAEPMTQSDMNACEEIDFQRTDLALNAVWRDAIAGARESDRGLDRSTDTRPGYETVLRAAQRAWLTFRDQHCTWQAYGEARGGTMEPMSYSACRAALTRERTAQLRGDQSER